MSFLPSFLAIPIWCPVEGCTCDVVLFLSHDWSDPSLWSLHDNGPHYGFGCTGLEVHDQRLSLARISALYFSEVLGVDGERVGEVTFCHSPTI